MLFLGTCLLFCSRMAMPICSVSMAASFHWSKIDSGLGSDGGGDGLSDAGGVRLGEFVLQHRSSGRTLGSRRLAVFTERYRTYTPRMQQDNRSSIVVVSLL
ncbi:hypothetical protein F7725_001334 [Dissostichus mawsoni]|uniref:Secreted protein n=1 Tax=Dissostichus mawsoni TaxID=36200 RepID=A0A7J5ZJF2_DISMA|nr:hypothetical protein F7725_001334 [Dissostichus mawsoni]